MYGIFSYIYHKNEPPGMFFSPQTKISMAPMVDRLPFPGLPAKDTSFWVEHSLPHILRESATGGGGECYMNVGSQGEAIGGSS